MDMSLDRNWVVTFDLDDTLCKEVEFLHSGFRAISQHLAPYLKCEIFSELLELYEQGAANPFAELIAEHKLSGVVTTEDLLEIYRYHLPEVTLSTEVYQVLEGLRERGVGLSVVTDGRSRSQRNKLEALGLTGYFDPIVVSEEIGSSKPSEANFRRVMERHPGRRYVYIGDNVAKDFIGPNRLGWTTVCLLSDGRNIVKQHFDHPAEYLPSFSIRSLTELL